MPLNKRKAGLFFLYLTIPLVVLVVLTFLPSFQTVVEAEEEIVLMDWVLEQETINTEEASDTLTIYIRASTSNPEISIGIDAMVAPHNETFGTDYSTSPQSQGVTFELMTEGCDVLPAELDVVGLEGGCGNQTDGVFSVTVDFPQYSMVGDWIVYSLSLYDNTAGLVSIDVPIDYVEGTIGTEDGDKNVVFSNEATVEDLKAPVIKSYAFDKESIDTTDGAETLTMYTRFSDDLTGVSDEFPPTIQFVPENDPGFAYPEMVEFEFTLMESGCDALPTSLDVSGLVGCGDGMDGIYVASVEIPRYSSGGTWNVEGVWNLEDLLGNGFDEDGLEASFNNTSTVYDTDAPSINSISITPSSFETVDGPQTVIIEMEIKDDMAGVDVGGVSLANGIRSVTSMSDAYWNETTQLTGGTLTDGTFTMEVIFPQGATKGFWVVGPIDVIDVLGRVRRYTTMDLALNFPELPLYLLNQGTTEQVQLQEDWTLEEWPYYQDGQVVWPDISVRFEEGTVITKEEGGVFAFHRMLATKYDLSTNTGVGSLLDGVNSDYQADLLDCDPAEGCTSTAVDNKGLVGTPLHIIKMGIPGLNLSFSKPVTIIVGMDEQYLGSTFIVQTFDEEQNKWIEHGSCTVTMIEPPSTEHGGDAFGMIKPVAYPGCSFTTTHASFFSTNVLGLETEEEELAGVPETGLGGIENSCLTKYFEWLK
jgi:hypothetical protein